MANNYLKLSLLVDKLAPVESGEMLTRSESLISGLSMVAIHRLYGAGTRVLSWVIPFVTGDATSLQNAQDEALAISRELTTYTDKKPAVSSWNFCDMANVPVVGFAN